jgi:hypothetical protein
MRFEVLEAINIKIAVSGNVTPCTFVDRYQFFRRNLQYASIYMKAKVLDYSETFELIYQTTRRDIQEYRYTKYCGI